MKLSPINEHVVLERDATKTKTDSGKISLPESAQEAPNTATVIASGSNLVSKGDRVVIGERSGVHVKVDGKTYLIIRADGIMAKVTA